jgi:hypothetical protein
MLIKKKKSIFLCNISVLCRLFFAEFILIFLVVKLHDYIFNL